MRNLITSIILTTSLFCQAQITQIGTVSTGIGTGTITHTNAAGSNRLLVYVLSFKDNLNLSLVATNASAVTYGGQAMTRAVVDAATVLTQNSVSIWYLQEAGIAAASSSSFAITWSDGVPGSAGGRLGQTAFTLAGVDQTTSICGTGSGIAILLTNFLNLSSPIPVLPQEFVVYGTSVSDDVTHTPPSGYTEISDQGNASGIAQSVGVKITTATGTESPTVTTSSNVGIFVTAAARIIPNGATCFTVLPIELSYFKASIKQGNKVLLQWQTVSENDNDFFVVERSSNGIDWTALKKIDVAEHSASPVNYLFVDEGELKGTVYYRLRQTNINGHYKYSEIRQLTLNKTATRVQIYPNPSSSFVTIEGDREELGKITVLDVQGRNVTGLISVKQQAGEKLTADISALKSGIYYLKTASNAYPVYKN